MTQMGHFPKKYFDRTADTCFDTSNSLQYSEISDSNFQSREVRFKKVSQSVFFSHKNRKSANFFDLCVVRSQVLYQWKELGHAHPINTYNIVIRPTIKLLETFEKNVYPKIQSKWGNFARIPIHNLEYVFLKSDKNCFLSSCNHFYVSCDPLNYTKR